jgi:glycerol-3-phosphate O-acyltransferase/dihydroxyacetone phosphate acyltransferase
VFYALLKPIVRIFYKIYYRQRVKGLENFPLNNPVVIIPNHVNGFIDPVVTGMFASRKIRFFARGDVFKGKFARWILNDLSVSPMYRATEGYADVKKNDKTFEECRRLLTEGKAILIFPEGICIQDRRLKKLKKGLARIVLGVEEEMKSKGEILVLPVGLNYSHPAQFRSRLLVNFGKPISLEQFRIRYKEDKVRAINECTLYLEEEMKKLIVVVDHPDNDELYESLVEIYTRQWVDQEGRHTFNPEAEFDKNKALAAMINALHEVAPVQLQIMKDRIAAYVKALEKYKLRDHLLRRDMLFKMNLKSILLDFVTLWFGLPVYWMGWLFNFPPFRIARNIADEKAKKKEFYSSIYANLSMFFWIPYYLLQLIVIAYQTHTWWLTVVWAVWVPASGYFALYFYPVKKKIFGRWKLLGLVRKNKAEAERLIYEREELIELIKEGLTSSGQLLPTSN